VGSGHVGGGKRVALQIEHLGAVRLGHPHVADPHQRPLHKRSIAPDRQPKRCPGPSRSPSQNQRQAKPDSQ
jgi:hypothetical protein